MRSIRAPWLAATSFLLVGIAIANYPAHAQSLDSSGVRAVPTYEAVGLYWSSPGANSTTGCEVKFRSVGSSSWTQGLNLWFDASKNECRGSLVNLAAGTSYEVQLNLPGAAANKGTTFSTWSNTVPVASTVKVPSGSATYTITQGGSASGYVVYDGTGSTLDAANGQATNINVNASYVIVRGFTLKGAQQHGILIDKNQHDVILEDNDISGWGRTRDGTWGTDMDSGIRAICVNEELTRVTVQRNKIHDPRYSANSWAVAHPAGPQGVTFSYCGGNNVYRWNEVNGGANHFNDAMGGEDNFSTAGWPNHDSDVYGNIVQNVWDDGLEVEGGDMNVRVWGNYLNNTGTAISSTVDSVGPLYIFRNVWNRNQFIQGAACDSDQKQPMFKSGSSSDFGNGRRYLFHNTMLQAQQAGCSNGLGGGAGVGGTGDTQLVHNTVSMNNIYHLWKANSIGYQIGTDNTFQNDMYNGSTGTTVISGINATPTYAAGNGWQSESNGAYALAAGTPGYDQGARIPNFNDDYVGAAPDVGAAEAGKGAMKFGVAAANSTSSVGGTGTTPPPTTPPVTPPVTPPPASGSAPVSSTIDSSSYTITAGQGVTFTVNATGQQRHADGHDRIQGQRHGDRRLHVGRDLRGQGDLHHRCARRGHAPDHGRVLGRRDLRRGRGGPDHPDGEVRSGDEARHRLVELHRELRHVRHLHRDDHGRHLSPSGTVAFKDATTVIGGCSAVALSGGVAKCTTSALARGGHPIRGYYSGDARNSAGVAGPITETIK